jgi:hypothetical protein
MRGVANTAACRNSCHVWGRIVRCDRGTTALGLGLHTLLTKRTAAYFVFSRMGGGFAHCKSLINSRMHFHVIVHFEGHTRPYIAMLCCQGPVFLAQYLALCDSAIEAASLLCPTGIALGIIVIFLCPIGFLILATVYVRHHLRTRSLVYEQNSRPSFSELKVWMENSAHVHESRATEPTSDNNASRMSWCRAKYQESRD